MKEISIKDVHGEISIKVYEAVKRVQVIIRTETLYFTKEFSYNDIWKAIMYFAATRRFI